MSPELSEGKIGKDTIVERIIERYKDEKGNIIPLLQEIQDAFGYIPEDAVAMLSERLDIPESRLYGIATFYPQFYLKPRGKNVITACSGTACHVNGSDRLINAVKKELNLTDENNTTQDKNFTLEQVACVGACGIAPVVLINKKVYGKMAVDKLTREIKRLKGVKI